MRGPIRAKRGRPSSTKFVLLHASLHGLVYSLRSATLGNGGGSHGEEGYGQFCPVAKAAELLAERWMPVVVRELLAISGRERR